MNLPSNTLLTALGLWFASAIVTAFEPALGIWCSGFGALLLLWAAADWLLARAQDLPAAQRVVANTLAVGTWSHVELRLYWQGRVPSWFAAFDHHPVSFRQEGLPASVSTHGKNSHALRYRVQALARGDHHFGRIQLRIRSPWHAWLRQVSVGEEMLVRVFPNFAPLARHALRAVDYRNALIGLQKRRRRGQGMDFAQLREYREGDAMRQVDWKATMRMSKMISREYQDERDQRILMLIDCGRRMGARDGNLSHFDHSLDAVLMLAYVSLSHGDRVGLMTLGGPERFLPTQHSSATVSRILRETYDLQPTLQVSDFERAAQQLLLRERKRALVVLMTNLRDEDDQGLIAATRLLGKRHLVLVASMRESALDRAQEEPADTPHAAARLAAAVGYARRREATLRRLRAEGVLCLDVAPEELAVETVNRYLAVKAANQL
jgi:uncharacterized protein (DUF58 family)